MSETPSEDPQPPDREDDGAEPLLQEQEGKGYGEDEGERDESLSDE